jgi:hypothetical protein
MMEFHSLERLVPAMLSLVKLLRDSNGRMKIQTNMKEALR